MALAVVLVLLVVGSLIFHFASPWWFTEIASNWQYIDNTVLITFWVTGIVFVAVNLFMANAVIKYRYREDRRARYEPENTKLEVWLTVVTTIGVAAMLAPGLIVWAQFVEPPEDAAIVEAVGKQWHWSFRYPGADGQLGHSDARHVGVDNPFGMDPDDPLGQDDVLVESNRMHLPLNRPVKVLLRSQDVLHDFAVPQMRVKMDLVPGLVTYLWFEPIRVGEFEILCEELCGVAHHTMRGMVVVEEQGDFDTWLAEQPTYSDTLAVPPGDPAAGKAMYAVCTACHGAQGEGNVAMNAPKQTGLPGWYMRRQLQYYQQGIRGAHDGDVFGKQMAPMAGTLATASAMNNVIAYIESLPNHPASTTVEGDVERGAKLWVTCAACHGQLGQGIWGQNAPPLAGMSDWYLVRQLQNYKDGIRGAHRHDKFGIQMTLMANTLHDEPAINDIVAFINTLPVGQQVSQTH
jgi:cytochrome c oxidase subunit 2